MPMITADLDRFFRARRVAVLAIARGDRAPLATPVWYDWDGTRFAIQVEATSAKAKLVRKRVPAPVTLTIQSEVPPYRYAVVYGTATIGPNVHPGLRTRLARRYFGRTAGDMYVAQEEGRGVDEAALQVIAITPERVVSHDFRPEAGASGRLFFAVRRWFFPVPA